MLRMLVPVDGSANSDRAVKYVIDLAKRLKSTEVLALNVQPAVSYVELMLGPKPSAVAPESERAGRDAARSACALLEDAGVAYTLQVEQGQPAETIGAFAKLRNCELIVMGTRGMGLIKTLAVGSVATKVIHLVDVPVTLVK